MNRDLLRRAARMLDEGSPYVFATIVRCERPTSGKPGDTSIITPEGVMYGWIGGNCTQSEVIRHALKALDAGEPRLLSFGSTTGRAGDKVRVPMSCSSGGKVEVHINPILPPPVLLVVGGSPVGHALVRLGRAVGYATVAGTPDDPALVKAADSAVEDLARASNRYAQRPRGARLFAVVATMGVNDERALRHLAAARPDYLGVVASHERMERVRGVLVSEGVSGSDLGRVRGPAGLDIGAATPEEIGVSILAEIVERGRHATSDAVRHETSFLTSDAREKIAPPPAGEGAEWAIDPVCGMTVPVASSPSSIFDGEPVHFCCDGCRNHFEQAPEHFLADRRSTDAGETPGEASSASTERHE